MLRRLAIAVMVAALTGCSSGSVEWAGAPEVNFHGVKVALPNQGRGQVAIDPDSLTWQHGSLTLTLRDCGDGSVLIQRNGETIGTARPGQSVKFNDDGRIESQE